MKSDMPAAMEYNPPTDQHSIAANLAVFRQSAAIVRAASARGCPGGGRSTWIAAAWAADAGRFMAHHS